MSNLNLDVLSQVLANYELLSGRRLRRSRHPGIDQVLRRRDGRIKHVEKKTKIGKIVQIVDT